MNERVEGPDQHDDAWYGKIETLFSGKADSARVDEVYAHLKTCDRCERTFNRFALAEKGLFKRAHALSPHASERVGRRIFKAERKSAARFPIVGLVAATV